MIRLLLSVLFLLSATTAQCFGTHPPGVGAVGAAPGARCSNIPGTSNGPWCSLSAALVASTGGPLSVVASNLPVVGSAPGAFPTWAHFDFSTLPAPAVLPSGCTSAYVLPTIPFPFLLLNSTGCQSVFLTTIPPVPALVGGNVFGQVFLFDTLRAVWASSNVFRMTFQ